MARKKTEKVIHLITETFEGSAVETLLTLEPGPVFLVSGETPDGPGIYLCDKPFTLEEAEVQHNFGEPYDAEAEIEEIEVVPELEEME